MECGISLKEAKLKIDLWLITNTTIPIGKMVVSYTDRKNHMLFKRLRSEKLYVIVLITIQRVSAHAFAVAKAQKFQVNFLNCMLKLTKLTTF